MQPMRWATFSISTGMLAAILVASGCASTGAAPPPAAGEAETADPIRDKVGELERREGLLAFYPDPREGRLWLELPPAEEGGRIGEYLYVEGLATGLGSNPAGLDRGQLGESRLVVFRRLGNRILVEEPNLRFRALSDDPAEVAATRESFAPSVLWGAKVEAESPDGRTLVDFTPFVVRDAHDVATGLERMGEGSFELDPERSAVDLDACLAFPDNVELEAVLTFAGRDPGPEVRRTVPRSDAFTLVLHHSLVRLPDDGYHPRAFDPRAGSFAIDFQDYAVPLDEPIDTRWIVRHRLRSAPGEPAELVYYVDRGIPEPVRAAVVDGVGWWAEAFDAAGFPGAFRVELLPEGAHPLDVRYNVVQWVHRSTRGWSYGGGVIDPRTGEMLKGHVNLGSLRVRQDRLIFEGLLGADGTGSGAPDDPIELSLARIRQLAAHEVGHTLGLAHNFAASTYGRASVMDYPAPLVRPAEGGGLDVSEAYGVGVGAWDVHAVRYAYAELEDEEAGLAGLIREGLERDLVMLSDADARPAGAAEPFASLWDNGSDPVAWLDVTMEVRRRALAAFGEHNVTQGRPLAHLEEVLATVYLHHRYQLDAAVKAVGGRRYRYAVRGDGQPGTEPLPGEAQRRALRSVLATLAPAELDLPESVLRAIHPRPFGYGASREQFSGGSAPVFDPLAAAATAADLAVSGLLRHERVARLVDQHRRDPRLPSLVEALRELVGATFDGVEVEGRRGEIGRVVQAVVVSRLIELASRPGAAPGVRARVESVLESLIERLAEDREVPVEAAHRATLAREIARHLDRPAAATEVPPGAPAPPPGPPIGSAKASLGSGESAGEAPAWGECSFGPGPRGERE